jgi:hypothetical protein
MMVEIHKSTEEIYKAADTLVNRLVAKGFGARNLFGYVTAVSKVQPMINVKWACGYKQICVQVSWFLENDKLMELEKEVINYLSS